MSSAAPVMKPTTTGYGMNLISLPPPETAITIWMSPESTMTTASAPANRSPPTPASVRATSVPANSTSAGPVGALITPLAPPMNPEMRLRHAAPMRPASAPLAASLPASAKSTTP